MNRARRGGIKVKVASIVKIRLRQIWERDLEIQGFDINTSLVSVETRANLFRASWTVQPPKGTAANYNGIIRRGFAVEGSIDSPFQFRSLEICISFYISCGMYGEAKEGWIFLKNFVAEGKKISFVPCFFSDIKITRSRLNSNSFR